MTAHRRRLLSRRPPPRHARPRAKAPGAGAVAGLALFVGTMAVVTAGTYRVGPTIAGAGTVRAFAPAESTTDAASEPGRRSIPGPPARAGALPGLLTGAAPSSTVPPATTSAPRRLAPARVALASIGVDTPLVSLGLHADGTLEVPSDFQRAGWYRGGPAPGEVGPAIVAGHVDSFVGPAVFARLARVQIGALVNVTRVDGSHLSFRVTRVERHRKTAFPAATVYGPTPGPELRLITCGGEFDRVTQSYRDNVVVYAVLA